MTVIPAFPVAVRVRYTIANRPQGNSDSYHRALRSLPPITTSNLTGRVL
ncbi:hypothetical protein [Arsenophonus endosymbiont of Aleurodicus floccissimus]|nr:hypothetical protein [Arsenophonus endosymbiont of Aleurodicus floccissimus]